MSECYMCNAKATTTEHVPPKCIFPEQKDSPNGIDLRKQLITVGACELHNTSKSKDDEYLLYVLAMNLPANDVGKQQFLTKIKRSIQRTPKLIAHFLHGNEPIKIRHIETGIVKDTLAININTRFDGVIDMLSRALYFHHFGEKWLGDICIQPNFLFYMNDAEANETITTMTEILDDCFKNNEYFGENPSVFKYQVAAGTDKCACFLRLHFYENCKITIFFGLVSD